MNPLAPRAAVVVLLTLPLSAGAQAKLDTDDPWDGRSTARPLDVIDPWDESRPPIIDENKVIVPPWTAKKRLSVRELNLIDPWTQYPKQHRPKPRRALSVVDPWAADAPEVPTAAFPMIANDPARESAPAETSPRRRSVPTAAFPLLAE